MNDITVEFNIWDKQFDVILEEYPQVTYEPVEIYLDGHKPTSPTYSHSFVNWILGIAGKPKPGITRQTINGRAIAEPIKAKFAKHHWTYFQEWIDSIINNELEYRPKRSGYIVYSNETRVNLFGMLPIQVEQRDDEFIDVVISFDHFTIGKE